MLMLIEILRLVQEYCFIFRKRQWNPVCKFSRKIPDLSNQATTNWHNPNDVEDTRKTLTQLSWCFHWEATKCCRHQQISQTLFGKQPEEIFDQVDIFWHNLNDGEDTRKTLTQLSLCFYFLPLPCARVCKRNYQNIGKTGQTLLRQTSRTNDGTFSMFWLGGQECTAIEISQASANLAKQAEESWISWEMKKLFLQINKHSNKQQMNTRIQMIKREIK